MPSEADIGDAIREEGQRRLGAGKRAWHHAEYLATMRSPEAEPKARAALTQLASAMNWLELTDEFEAAHKVIDEAGRFVRQTFGCLIHFEDGKYTQRCPVWIAHFRMG